jgi:hypothetical protein
MDQTPLSFKFLDRKTYNTKGAKTIWVKTARSGWDKRQATLQIVLHADGVNRCKPLLIFKAKGDRFGRPVDGGIKAESKTYNKRVKVVFNEKAYSNMNVMLEWIKTMYSQSTAVPFYYRDPIHEPRLLSLDVFKGQLNDEVIAAFKQINCTCSFIPGGTTGYIQVCDVAINKPLKDRIAEQAELHYDQHEEKWIEGKYLVGERRVMLASWVGQAWEDLHKFDSESIRQAFRDVGLALPIDGSRDNEIKIKDLVDLEVGDWKSWTPTGGIPQPSNKEHETVSLADLEISMTTTTATTTTTTTTTKKITWLDS